MIESQAVHDGESVGMVGVKSLLAQIAPQPDAVADTMVTGVAFRADEVCEGDVFFCVRGKVHDGHGFADAALARGAAALVVERELLGLQIPQYVVPDTRLALGYAAAEFWGRPSESMQVFGVTGTNGKTTTTYVLDSILRAAGHTTGIIGTVETRIGNERVPATRTTPESSEVQALLARMRDAGVTAVSMEVSSHAIDLHRVDAVAFAAVGFTNLTQDHLDYHETISQYAAVKKRLFTDFSVSARVIDTDDEFGAGMAKEFTDAITVGRRDGVTVRASEESPSPDGTCFILVTGAEQMPVRLPLSGGYNVNNALMAAGCALSSGIPLTTVVAGLEAAPQVPGRLERIDEGQRFAVLVDYAHTPDSLDKASAAVKRITSGRTIVVFGCGGDRDPSKRPLMAAAAARHADLAIITSDNPRSEDPASIISQIEPGLAGTAASYEIVLDRQRAILRALELAQPGDSVLIAGKGHENYQIFADKTIHFDDREVAREGLRSRC